MGDKKTYAEAISELNQAFDRLVVVVGKELFIPLLDWLITVIKKSNRGGF